MARIGLILRRQCAQGPGLAVLGPWSQTDFATFIIQRTSNSGH
jgi:hypothetical protein